MIDDREIWECANLLVQQHGENAWFVAARRADEPLAPAAARRLAADPKYLLWFHHLAEPIPCPGKARYGTRWSAIATTA
jgi:hypothetical protein